MMSEPSRSSDADAAELLQHVDDMLVELEAAFEDRNRDDELMHVAINSTAATMTRFCECPTGGAANTSSTYCHLATDYNITVCNDGLQSFQQQHSAQV